MQIHNGLNVVCLPVANVFLHFYIAPPFRAPCWALFPRGCQLGQHVVREKGGADTNHTAAPDSSTRIHMQRTTSTIKAVLQGSYKTCTHTPYACQMGIGKPVSATCGNGRDRHKERSTMGWLADFSITTRGGMDWSVILLMQPNPLRYPFFS